MFNDDLPMFTKESIFPRNIDDLSVSDLKDYLVELEEEITKVKTYIEQKKSSSEAAASFFK